MHRNHELLARILWAFYNQRKDVNRFLSTGSSFEHANYIRLMVLGCLDALITLPSAIAELVINYAGSGAQSRPIVFYQGWTVTHTDWAPIPVPRSAWTKDRWAALAIAFGQWITPLYATIFFVLFGFTRDARRAYRWCATMIVSLFLFGGGFAYRGKGMEEGKGEPSEVVFGSSGARSILMTVSDFHYLLSISRICITEYDHSE